MLQFFLRSRFNRAIALRSTNPTHPHLLRNLMFESSVSCEILPPRNHINKLHLGNKFRYTELQGDVSKNTTFKTPSSPTHQARVRLSPGELVTFAESITTSPQRRTNDTQTMLPMLARHIH